MPASHSMTSAYAILILLAIGLMHILFGGGDGTRLIYVLPSYVLLGLMGLLTAVSFSREKSRIDRGCLLTVGLLSLYLLIRIALSPVAFLARVEFLVLLASLLVYFVSALFLGGTRWRVAIVIFLLLIGLGQVAVGVFQFARDSNLHPLVLAGRGDASQRASGFFISPNHLAGYLEVALIFGASLFFWGAFKAWVKVLIAYLTLVCAAGLVLTGSRGGYLGATFGMAVFATLSVWTARSALSRQAAPRLVAIIVIVSLAGAVLGIATERSHMLRSRADSVFVSKDIRLQLWAAAWQQFKLAPVFGTGSRTYLYHGRQFRAPAVQTDPVFAHNDYLQTLAEYGAAGLAFFVAFIAAHLWRAWRSWLRMIKAVSNQRGLPADRNALALQLGSMGAIAAYLFHSVTDFNLHIPANALLLAFVFGMVASRTARPAGETERWPARLPRALPAVFGLWMLAASVPKLPGELFVETSRGRMMSGDITGSLAEAERALEWGSRTPELFYYLGEGRRLLGAGLRTPEARVAALEAALQAYEEGLALFPQDVRLVLITAWALDKLDRVNEAEARLARAVELDPNSGFVWAYQAWHSDQIGNATDALAHARRASQLGCDVGAAMRVVGERLDLQLLERKAAAVESPPSPTE